MTTNAARMSLKTLPLKPQERLQTISNHILLVLLDLFILFYFFGILNAAVPSVLNPNNPSVPET